MKHRLTLISGVHPMNDNVVGSFNDERTAFLVGDLLLALDKNDHPEYSGKEIVDQPEESDLPPAYVVDQDGIVLNPRGFLVVWKTKGGQEAAVWVRERPKPSEFNKNARVIDLFEKGETP